MFRLLRFYSLTSFVVIVFTAAFLTLFYRQVTMYWIDHLAKTNNQAVAQTALNSIGPELVAYLGAVADGTAHDIRSRPLPAELVEHMRRMTRDTTVGRIEIYNRTGLLVFSTRGTAPSGANQRSNPAFLTALTGDVSNSMIFRDIFNHFEGATAQDNQMQTYTPIRVGEDGAVLGVFATETDMSHLIHETDRVLVYVLAGAATILALLYAILFVVVRHAKNILDAQHKTIQERTASLEILSKRLLKGEEIRKKKLAAELHEGLAQTLSAIKVNMENRKLVRDMGAETQPLAAIVPVLQSAIHEVRTMATELRPSSLDDLGLLPTINWFCREFERQHPGIAIEREISLPEGVIPSQLKIVIFRIIESAFRNIAKYSNTDQIRFLLHLAGEVIHLVIEDSPTTESAVASVARFDPGADPQFRFAEMKERTTLSGGAFSTTLENTGWVTLRASWVCAE